MSVVKKKLTSLKQNCEMHTMNSWSLYRNYPCLIAPLFHPRYEFNKHYQVKSIVPMLQLSWHLAKNLKISDTALWEAIRSVLQRSLRQSILTIELVKKIKGLFVPCLFFFWKTKFILILQFGAVKRKGSLWL